MNQTVDIPPVKVSNMTYSEMVSFFHLQLGRVEMTWFRIMYLHAAIVGILVFFAEAGNFFPIQRVLVFSFFTVNLLIFQFSLKEGYDALESAHKDILQFPKSGGHVDQWFRSRRYLHKTIVRNTTVFATWMLIGFLLFRSLIWG